MKWLRINRVWYLCLHFLMLGCNRVQVENSGESESTKEKENVGVFLFSYEELSVIWKTDGYVTLCSEDGRRDSLYLHEFSTKGIFEETEAINQDGWILEDFGKKVSWWHQISENKVLFGIMDASYNLNYYTVDVKNVVINEIETFQIDRFGLIPAGNGYITFSDINSSDDSSLTRVINYVEFYCDSLVLLNYEIISSDVYPNLFEKKVIIDSGIFEGFVIVDNE